MEISLILPTHIVIARIYSIQCQKLLVCASLSNATVSYHENFVRISDCRKSVGDCDSRSVLCQLLKTFLDKALALIVKGTGCLIKY